MVNLHSLGALALSLILSVDQGGPGSNLSARDGSPSRQASSSDERRIQESGGGVGRSTPQREEPTHGNPALFAPSPQELAARAAIARGLAYLAAEQAKEPDGSVPSIGQRPTRLANTALSLLAWMSAGSGLERGPHGSEMSRAVDYILTRVERDPTSRNLGFISDGGEQLIRMHSHGFAVLAMAEAYAASPRSDRGARLAEALTLAVGCIERSQSLEGGWYYQPVRGIDHEGSITIALVQALRSAKGAGLRVDPEVIAKAEDYVRRSQAEEGAFRYMIGSDKVSVALTAAAISTLNAAGTYHGPEIQQGYDYIARELQGRASLTSEWEFRTPDGQRRFPYYERLYLAQAYWQNPDRTVFTRWFESERERVLKAQNEDGSWGHPDYGSTYATAMNVLVLALPDQLLPIFQR
jgi:hypothetical protein